MERLERMELSSLNGFKVPRPLRLPAPTITWLHTFSDASKDEYAAVSYLVCEYDNYGTTSRLVASKSRVTPLKSVIIPRLELMGAVLASRLTTSLLQTLDVMERHTGRIRPMSSPKEVSCTTRRTKDGNFTNNQNHLAT